MCRPACQCFVTPFEFLEPRQELGMDSRFGEVSVLVCRKCSRYWLKYVYELEAFSGSGRWYLGPITTQQRSDLTAETAKSVLEGLDWYDYGGSYFYGHVGRASGPITLP